MPDWNSVIQTKVQGTCAVLPCGAVLIPTNHGDLTLSVTQTGLRIQNHENASSNDYGILLTQAKTIMASIKSSCIDGNTFTHITAQSHSIIVQHNPFSFEWKKADKIKQKTPNDGHFVRQFRLPPFAKTDEGWLFILDLAAE